MFLKNSSMLVPGGQAYLMVKARSVDMTKDPASIYEDISRRLKALGWDVRWPVVLDPYQADHACLMVIKQ
jgi:fibrillarin-like pre-rRNA processing protein